ncbi:MAG: monovalent cation/H(+) antiporter subunit G [Oscillospiraceae bacterium]
MCPQSNNRHLHRRRLFFAFAGAVGVVRMPDTFSRMQSSTNITTLGMLLTLIGALLYFIFVMHSWGTRQRSSSSAC